MMDIRGYSPALAELARIAEREPEIAREEIVGAMERAVLVVEREVVHRTPTNKVTTGGRLRNAIHSAVATIGRTIRGWVGVANVSYAPFVENDTKAHDIYPKAGKALVFSPVAGFKLAYRDTTTGRVLGARTARARGGVGLQVERGRALFQVAGKPGRTTTNRANAAQVIVRHVRHPGTKGYHMFRDGWQAARPQVERIFEGALRRLTARLK